MCLTGGTPFEIGHLPDVQALYRRDRISARLCSGHRGIVGTVHLQSSEGRGPMGFFSGWWEHVRTNAVRYAPLIASLMVIALERRMDYFWE